MKWRPAGRVLALLVAGGLAVAGRGASAEEGFWPCGLPPIVPVKETYFVELDRQWFERLRLASVRVRPKGSPSSYAAAGCFVGKNGLVLTKCCAPATTSLDR